MGHCAVHQERELFPSASFQIWELGAWTLNLQLVNVPLSRHLTSHD